MEDKDKRVGFFLGKFAPFHKGHQMMIETALKEVDELVAMIYDCPETTDVPMDIRANWIRTLYPQVKLIEAWDGPREAGLTPELKKMHQDYAIKLLDGKKITHYYSSEFYGDHMSKALGAKNCLIDEDRINVPISATKARGDAYKYREYLDPIVYRDLITRIVFLGGPSTGKSTLTKELAKRYNTKFMTEYGREYWEKHQIERRLTLKQLTEIAKGHIEGEDKVIMNANKYFFVDTNAITTYLFSLYYHGKADPELKEIAGKCVSRYDLIFVCDTDIPYDDSWDRSGDVNRDFFQKQTISYLEKRKIPYIILNGNLKERMDKVEQVINGYKLKNLNSLIKAKLY